MSTTEYFRDNDGKVIGLQGLLPNGEYGVIFDEDRPFTDEELNDADKFKLHSDDLANRVDKGMATV